MSIYGREIAKRNDRDFTAKIQLTKNFDISFNSKGLKRNCQLFLWIKSREWRKTESQRKSVESTTKLNVLKTEINDNFTGYSSTIFDIYKYYDLQFHYYKNFLNSVRTI